MRRVSCSELIACPCLRCLLLQCLSYLISAGIGLWCRYVKCLEERVKLLEERNEKLLEELEKARSGKMSEEEKIAQTSRIETEYKQDVGGALPDNPEPPTPMATTPGGTVASFNQKIAAQVIS